ncbi:MAG: CHC2 zinc finger domain-containing protein, partial [Thermoanaerobaculia bacterium]|nr:CHC2 zinc finger domain-containing protein [Thermoanaerobaculia bacterium]
MARVPAVELERIKRDVPVERLVAARGVSLRRHGKDLIGLCPFHDDTEPSLVISPAKNLWHCLGACQTGGSVIDWVMRAEGVSFRHAVELLRTGVAATETAPIAPVKHATTQKLPSAVDLGAEGTALLGQVVDFYSETLLESPDALDYLRSRGIGQRELLDRFRLGYGNRTLGLRMPKRGGQKGNAVRNRLQEVGILRRSGHEHFNGSVVVPVFGPGGEVVEMYGRKVTAHLRKGTPKHLYLPGPHRGVWNLGALRSSREVILCESLLDGLTFWAAGYRHVTSAYGIQGFTAEHLEAFQAYGTQRVLIAYDRDDAGEAAAKQLAPRLQDAGIECWRIQFPRGMDANEYALKVAPASKSLGLAIRKAAWMGSGKAPAKGPMAMPASVQETVVPEISAPEISSASSEPEPEPVSTPAPEPEAVPEPGESCPEAPVASPLPAAPARPVVPAEIDGDQVVIRLGDRRYRVRGLGKNLSYEVLKINLLAGRTCAGQDEGYHVDTFDLYSARHRAAFVRLAAEEMGVEEGVVRGDLGRVLLKLEELQDAQIRAALVPETEAPVEIPEGEREEALELLRDPRLLDRVLEDFARCGVVGEETNKLMGYLAAVSRKTDEPLAVIIRSSSAAGKTSLMEAILAFMPEEERVQYSAMTGQSLFYMGETDLAHKILAI